MKPIAELAPIVRIGLFVFGGWLQAQGTDSAVVEYVRTDPQVLSYAVLGATAAWYAVAKKLNWKR
jgi:hypothetical protein